ncbi:MAG: agmatine deiminase family protein, partial [Deltaproteobacteria bacterium]|nr:agmatine deiminase family protein [Deltaproteobacteria bacterium]
MSRLLILISTLFMLFMLSCADVQQGKVDGAKENFQMLPAYKLPYERQVALKGDQWDDFRLKHPEWFAITIPPNKTDYKLLEEYDDIQVLILAYPSTGLSSAVTKSTVEMAAAALQHMEVHVVSKSTAAQENFTKKLKDAGVSQEMIDAKLKYIAFELDSIWMVDYGPFPIKDTEGNIAFSDLRYYHYRTWDDAIPSRLAQLYGTTAFRGPADFEGGNMYYDGMGTCFHTQGAFWENPDMTQEEVQKVFSDYLGCKEFVVLKPLQGEGTTHIDMFFKLTDPKSAVLGEYTEAQDAANKKILDDDAAILEAFTPPSGGKFRVFRLPMPDNSGTGEKIWRTYINSTFTKPLNLWPVYSINKDLEAAALAVWEEAMPDFEHVAINSDVVITWGGAMHCISRTVMNGTYAKWIADGKCENNKCTAPEGGYNGDCTDDTQCYGVEMLCLCNDCKTDCKSQPSECGAITWEGCCG